MTEEDKQNTMTISDLESEPEPYEPFRNYTAVSEHFKLDWNMLLYKVEDDNGFQLDWNKLIYDEEQMAEFVLQKKEKVVKPQLAEFLFKPPCERSAMERFFLAQTGFCNGDEKDETDAEYDRMTANDIVMNA
jgi:hypothetical protein